VKVTFVDAGVLIAAARGGTEQAVRALAILDDPEREFVASPLPAPRSAPAGHFQRATSGGGVLRSFFSAATRWASDLQEIVAVAASEASSYGVQAMDALHVAAAKSAEADELVTAEKPSRAIHRARSVKVVTIHPETP